jgi:hypothetical protein
MGYESSEIYRILCIFFCALIPIKPSGGYHKLNVKKEAVKKAITDLAEQKASPEHVGSNFVNLIKGKHKRAEKTRLFIVRHSALFARAIHTLHPREGFIDLIHTIIVGCAYENIAGRIYELEKALEIEEGKTGEHVKALNYRIQYGGQEIECDIITNSRVIECKRGSQNTEQWRTRTANQLRRLKIALSTQDDFKELTLHLSVKFPHPPETMEWVAHTGAYYSNSTPG